MIKRYIMEAKIDVIDGVYIYREMVENRLLILAYDQTTRIFYQRIFTENEWRDVIPNFTLEEFSSIIHICCEKQDGYFMSIVMQGTLMCLNFTCREKIKTYQWSIGLPCKTDSDLQEIDTAFVCFQKEFFSMALPSGTEEGSDNYEEVAMSMQTKMKEMFSGLQNKICTIYANSKNEMNILSYITQKSLDEVSAEQNEAVSKKEKVPSSKKKDKTSTKKKSKHSKKESTTEESSDLEEYDSESESTDDGIYINGKKVKIPVGYRQVPDPTSLKNNEQVFIVNCVDLNVYAGIVDRIHRNGKVMVAVPDSRNDDLVVRAFHPDEVLFFRKSSKKRHSCY